MTQPRTFAGSQTDRHTLWWMAALLALSVLFLAGCQETGQMIDQPRYDPLEPSTLFPDGRSARPLVPGSVPYSGNQSPNDPALTGLGTDGQPVKGFPQGVAITKDLVTLGQQRYNIYCIPCHGETGTGNGKVIGFGFPKPPDLLGANAKGLSNGDIFQIITNGRNKMLSYGYRVKPDERWAVISYIRALQMKNGAVDPTALTPAELQQIGSQQ